MPVLTNETHERYARLRAILVPPRAAVKSLGLSIKSGVASKLEHNEAIKARIAEIAAVEEDVLREKRDQIEMALSAIAYGDGSEFPGKRIALEWTNRLHAIHQLRDLHGFIAPKRSELTGKNGGAIEVENYTDADRVKAVASLLGKAKQAAEPAA